jgi:hypothetical protein
MNNSEKERLKIFEKVKTHIMNCDICSGVIDCEHLSNYLNISNRGYVQWSLDKLNIEGVLTKCKFGNRWKYSIRKDLKPTL